MGQLVTGKVFATHEGPHWFRYSRQILLLQQPNCLLALMIGQFEYGMHVWGSSHRPSAWTYQSITSLAFSGDGEILASGSDDKTIRIWIQSQTDSFTGLVHQDRVCSWRSLLMETELSQHHCMGMSVFGIQNTGALVSGPSKRHCTLAVVLIPIVHLLMLFHPTESDSRFAYGYWRE